MAGIIKRKDTWYACFRVGGKLKVRTTGIKITPLVTPGKLKNAAMKEAELQARIIAEELEKEAKGALLNADVIVSLAGNKAKSVLRNKKYMPSVKDHLHQWLANRPNRRANLRYGKAIRCFLDFLGPKQEMPLDTVTEAQAQRFMEKYLELLSSKTVSIYLYGLNAAFQQAVNERLFPYNPFKGVRPSKINRADATERRAFTVEEAQRLTEILPGEWPDMIRVCLYTGGQRLGDIATLQWKQIDMEGGIISMTTQKTKRHMNNPLIVPLKEVLDRRLANRASDYVFPVAAMRHAQADHTSSKLSIEFNALLKKFGYIEKNPPAAKGNRRRLAPLSFHSLRATAVTVLRLANVPADLCRFIVGHDPPSASGDRQASGPEKHGGIGPPAGRHGASRGHRHAAEVLPVPHHPGRRRPA